MMKNLHLPLLDGVDCRCVRHERHCPGPSGICAQFIVRTILDTFDQTIHGHNVLVKPTFYF